MLYKPRKIPVINAVKFDKNNIGSDLYRSLKIEDASKYPLQGTCQCGRPLYEHGIIRGLGPSGFTFICPDSYIIYEGTSVTSTMSAGNFEAIYKPYIDSSDVVSEI